MLRLITLTMAALGVATAPAFAHLNPAEHGSFMAGVSHPLTGADHILAMVAVGLWAALIGGRALWLVPSAFVGTMLFGFGLALSGVSLPMVEPAILASVVALGLLVALAVRLPVALSAFVVGLFALFHGYAHGGELGEAGAANFAIGFALSTIVLHGAGLLLGRTIGGQGVLPRLLGGATALGGLALMVG